MGQHLANVHGYRAGAEADQRSIPTAVIQFAETGAGKTHHQHQQPARIAQGNDLRKTLLDVAIVQQLMLGEDHNVLHFRHHMHINAAIDIFARRGKTFAIFNGGQDDGIRRDGAFNAVHPQRQPETC